LSLTETFIFEWHASRHGFVDRTLYANTPTFGKLFEPLRYHHTGAGQGTVGDYNLTHRDTDAKLRFYLAVKLKIVLYIRLLEGNGCTYRVGCTRKLGYQRVTAQLMGDACINP